MIVRIMQIFICFILEKLVPCFEANSRKNRIIDNCKCHSSEGSTVKIIKNNFYINNNLLKN